MEKNKITVIGSSNTDMVIKVERIPVLGETVLGGDFFMTDGGKGANQAVTIAKLGGDVTFIAKIGKDIFGDAAIQKYKSYGIDTKAILRDDNPSGVALIMVDSKGENSIAVASGANAKLRSEDVVNYKKNIVESNILLMQLETPIDTVSYAAQMAFDAGVKVILNPAPAIKIPDNLYRMLYMITPNRTEASVLSGIEVVDLQTAKQAASLFVKKGVKVVAITLGAEGSLVFENKKFTHVEASLVKVVDTTAAGDVFNGAICIALSEGKSVLEAVRFASRAAALSVTRIGAQSSIPNKKEVDSFLH